MENQKLTVIQNARIIRNGTITENQALAFENGLIVDLPDNWENAEIIDARGKYIIPGLIEGHGSVGGYDGIYTLQESVKWGIKRS